MLKNRQITTFAAILLVLISGPVFAKSSLENLGTAIYNDLNLSLNQNQSCQSCHHPSAGFADPDNRISPTLLPVSDGSITTLFGGRNAPTAAYSGFSPIFHYDYDEELFVGGLFWDGRASGLDVTDTGTLGAGPTGDPLADQAKGPFGNPVEMALTMENTGLSTEQNVVSIIQASDYADKFETEFGPNAFGNVAEAYNNASLAIAAFERSKNLEKFNSKFDKFIKEQGGDISTFGVEVNNNGLREYKGPGNNFKSKYFSYDEADGLAIFNADSYTQLGVVNNDSKPNGGMCYLCHLTTNHTVPDTDPAIDENNYNPTNGPAPGTYNPMLTDFTYDNLGLPVNHRIAELLEYTPDPDIGLGGQIALMNAAYGDEYPSHEGEMGKFKVPSLRNLPRTAPYGHNGFFATIYDIVHFYNTRDVEVWPVPEVPEVPETVNTEELGNLGLTLAQEQKLVLFMETLAD